jgi:DNA modification methylase
LGEYTIKQRDYLDTLKACEDAGGADLIATSPPYADARTYGMDCSFTDADYQRLAHGLWSALRPGGHALINLDAPVRDWTGDGRGTERGLHPWRFMLYAHDVVGFRLPDWLVFGRQGLPGAYAGRFRNDKEPLFWLQKPGADGFFDRWALAGQSATDYSQTTAHQRNNDGSLRLRSASGRAADEGIKHRGTLWDYGMVAHGQTGAPDIEAAGHPARWPYKLAHDIVVCFCPVNGIVCDPFLGAGTTMIAALEEGRRFIGGDLGARQTDGRPWVDVAADLWAARQRQVKLFGGAA